MKEGTTLVHEARLSIADWLEFLLPLQYHQRPPEQRPSHEASVDASPLQSSSQPGLRPSARAAAAVPPLPARSAQAAKNGQVIPALCKALKVRIILLQMPGNL